MKELTLISMCVGAAAFGYLSRGRKSCPGLANEFVTEKQELFRKQECSWPERFEALPAHRKSCRFDLPGVGAPRVCENAFECSTCEFGRGHLSRELSLRRPSDRAVAVAGLKMPAGYFFHRGHAWARVEDKLQVQVGLDDFARRFCGPRATVVMPAAGSIVEKGEVLFLVKRDGEVLPVLSPVDGRVLATNQDLGLHPELLARDPYGAGWVVRIKPSNLYHNLRDMLDGEEARLWMEAELQPLGRAGGAAMAADGGEMVEDLAPVLGENWSQAARDFLLTR